MSVLERIFSVLGIYEITMDFLLNRLNQTAICLNAKVNWSVLGTGRVTHLTHLCVSIIVSWFSYLFVVFSLSLYLAKLADLFLFFEILNSIFSAFQVVIFSMLC